jgi:hypothetical protein
MDSQNKQPISPSQIPKQQPLKPIEHEPGNTGQANNPKQAISDAESQALLTITSSGSNQHPKTKAPLRMLISAIVIALFVILAASFLLGGGFKSLTKGSSGSSSSGSSNQSDPSSTKGTYNQINQDEKSCTNPLTAVSEC